MKILSKKLQEYFQSQEVIARNIGEYIDLHVVIDSRLVKPGDTFVCIPGEKTDGHRYIQDAIQKGAIGFVVNQSVKIPPEYFQIVTDSPEKALRNAAGRILKEIPVKQIAITGSAGKTTTKELVFQIFSHHWKTSKTVGNYNTPIGVPVSLINRDQNSDYFICELSASCPGEIDQNLTYMDLQAGIITGIGSSHLEFFNSITNIFTEKMKITTAIRNQGPLLINGDQDWGEKAKKRYPNTVTFGFNKSNDIVAFDLQKQIDGTTFNVLMNGEIFPELKLSTIGDHFVYDALPGIFLAGKFGMSKEKIRESLKLFQAEIGRGRMIPFIKKTTIIDESYNANPYSFSTALKSFSSSNFARRIAVIGDMLELGADSDKLHYELGKNISASDINIVIYKGQYADVTRSGINDSTIQFYALDILSDIEKLLLSILQEGDGIFIKASNGTGLHILVKELEKKL